MISTCQRQPLTDIHTLVGLPACLLLKSEAPWGRRCLGRRGGAKQHLGVGARAVRCPGGWKRAGVELSTKTQGSRLPASLLYSVHILHPSASPSMADIAGSVRADISEATSGLVAGRKGTPTPVLRGGNFQGPTGPVNPSPPKPAIVSGCHGLGRQSESIHRIQEMRRVSLSQLGKDTLSSNEWPHID